MITLRLARVGRKNAPTYRIIAVPKHKDPWGTNNEILGNYNPRSNPPEFKVKKESVLAWIAKGAEVSDTLWNLFVDQKIVTGKKRSVTHISKTRAASLAEEAKKNADKKPAA